MGNIIQKYKCGTQKRRIFLFITTVSEILAILKYFLFKKKALFLSFFHSLEDYKNG